jgi:hypothetical protein
MAHPGRREAARPGGVAGPRRSAPLVLRAAIFFRVILVFSAVRALPTSLRVGMRRLRPQIVASCQTLRVHNIASV